MLNPSVHCLILTLLTIASAAEQSMTQRQQLMRMCQDVTVRNACRGLNLRRFQGQSCHDQLLNIVCNVRSLRCSLPGSADGEVQATMEDPICSHSCKRIFRGCATNELTLIAYVPVNDQLCNELPSQLCDDWSRPAGHRDDRAAVMSPAAVDEDGDAETELCQANGAAAKCDQVQYIADRVVRPRRISPDGRLKPARRRHPFRKSDFKGGNFTYAAEVKLARAGWQMEPSGRQPADRGSPYTGSYEKLLHLEITRVLYTGSESVGHILDPGSVQIVVLKAGCACAPLKLNQQLIFVGYNSYLENVWNQVVLLPSNSHYRCKIKRCWKPRSRRTKLRHRVGRVAAPAGESEAELCDCPCGRSERLKCLGRRPRRRSSRRHNFWHRSNSILD